MAIPDVNPCVFVEKKLGDMVTAEPGKGGDEK